MSHGEAGAQNVGALHGPGSVFTEKLHTVLIFAETEQRQVYLVHPDACLVVLTAQILCDIQIIGIFRKVHMTVDGVEPRLTAKACRLLMGAELSLPCRDQTDHIDSEFH